jgi:hypothetical protein
MVWNFAYSDLGFFADNAGDELLLSYKVIVNFNVSRVFI